MKRRHTLALLGSVLAGTAGCLDASGPPSVTGTEPTLAPGEQSTVSVEAENVGSMHVSALPAMSPAPDAVYIDLTDADLTPDPSSGAESFPPYWNWGRSRQSVTVTLPLRIGSDVRSGDYEYGVAVWNDADRSSEGTERTFSITVSES